MTAFIPGLRLAELFYREAVQPIMQRAFPDLPHAAALLGPGSDVLGYDTERSTDHDWGPRLLLLLRDDDLAAYAASISEILRRELPRDVHGYPTSFTRPDVGRNSALDRMSAGPVNHKVEITSVPRFVRQRLGITSYPQIDVTAWLVCSEQRLLEVTAGAVYHDGLGEVTAMREAFHYYPHDLWLYLLAAQWKRIGQHEPFVGRCGEVGDDVGSALAAASLVRDVMRLCFLIEKRYAPYAKWFGTAFTHLSCAGTMLPFLDGALAARSWGEREHYLSAAYTHVATLHNNLGITEPLPAVVTRFHDRPFLVIDAERFSRAIHAQIMDGRVRRLPADIGSVDQFVDSTDVLSYNDPRVALRAIYGLGLGRG